MTSMQIYWITRLDGIKNLGIGISAALGLALGLYLIWVLVQDGEDYEVKVLEVWKKVKCKMITLFIFLVLSIIANVLTPGMKQMAAIIVVPKIINNEQVQELPENILKLGNEWLKTKTEELKE